MPARNAIQNSASWHIHMLGNFRAYRPGGEEITRFPTQKTGALLAYLAYHAQGRHGREALIEMLWPGVNLQAGRPRLRVALNVLRRRLEPPSLPAGSVIYADALFIHLHADSIVTDVAEFERLLARAPQNETGEARVARLRQAVALYGGELMPGCYEEWLFNERERLAQRFLDALGALAGAYEAQGDFDNGLEIARRLIAVDNLREEGHLLLMRLYARAGRGTDALRQYQELEDVLGRGLQEAPSLPASALHAAIRDGKFAHAGFPISVLPASTAPTSTPDTLALPTSVPAKPTPILEPRFQRLPTSMTRFWGREAEITQLTALLRDPHVRLVTLVGIGGIGKTRLSIETARHLSEAFPVIAFVSLADVHAPERIFEAIATTLNLPRSGDVSALEQVTAKLGHARALLALDNFEHLVEGGRDVAQILLEWLPQLTLLLTTRERLNLSAEYAYPVQPFPIPDQSAITPGEALTYDSIGLFINRAQAASPGFQITVRNAPAIIAVCRRLEGIPLALELAASWAGTLSPSQMLARLNRRFEMLVSRRHDVPARHQTLRAVVEWSYCHLDPLLRRFFTQLSVFRGGWTLETAEIVCLEPNAAGYLLQLRAYALIVSEEVEETIEEAVNGAGDSLRYRMLETLREFASEHLEEEEQRALAERHARWCLTRLRPGDMPLREHENFRAALEWCRAQPESDELYLELVGALHAFWRGHGWWREGLACTEAALARADRAPLLLQARLCQSAGVLCWLLEDSDASTRYHARALVLFSSLDDKLGMAMALNSLGAAALKIPDPDFRLAQQYFMQALRLAQQIENDGMIVSLYGNLGHVAMEQKDWVGAQAHFQDCLTLCRHINQSDAWALQNLAELARAQAQWLQARALYEQSLAKYRKSGETYRLAEVLERLAEALQHCGKPEEANRCREESQLLSVQLRGA